MLSIRTHTGPIDLCASCGQPCYLIDDPDSEYQGAWSHFIEQWDGVGCQWFPFAGKLLGAKLDAFSVEGIRALYPDTH